MAAEVLASNQCIRFLSVKALYTRANRDHNMQLKLQLTKKVLLSVLCITLRRNSLNGLEMHRY
jgi:hypothetical protein